jgi:hypothetical protein
MKPLDCSLPKDDNVQFPILAHVKINALIFQIQSFLSNCLIYIDEILMLHTIQCTKLNFLIKKKFLMNINEELFRAQGNN